MIPTNCRRYIIRRLHGAQQGILKMLLKAKDNAYWPGIRIELTDIVNNCSDCQTYAYNVQCKPPHIPRENPTKPW